MPYARPRKDGAGSLWLDYRMVIIRYNVEIKRTKAYLDLLSAKIAKDNAIIASGEKRRVSAYTRKAKNEMRYELHAQYLDALVEAREKHRKSIDEMLHAMCSSKMADKLMKWLFDEGTYNRRFAKHLKVRGNDPFQ